MAWKVELMYKYTSMISHLMFDIEEQAKTERDKLLPSLGKDMYDMKKNGGIDAITLTDKFGTIDVVPSEVKSIRCYDADAWNEYAIPIILGYEREIALAKKID